MYNNQWAKVLTGGLLAALAAPAIAQTFTSCNPTQKTCPDDPALGTTYNQTFSSGSSFDSDFWKVDGGPATTFGTSGADFTIYQHGDAPTLQTSFYIFFGRVEVIMKAASGQGIISSIVLQSDDLDEIDWEIMGGNTTYVENNYYGKGNTKELNALYYPCDGPQASFHNYTTVWTSEQIQWYLDGQNVRTLAYGDAVFEGKSSYPQTPMFLKIGNWAAGDPSEPQGTIEWAGGEVNYNDGPFTMTIQSIKMTDGHTNATSYSYSNLSGSWQSIKVTDGISSANQKIHAPPPETVSQHWTNLPVGVKIAIFCVAVAVAVAMVGALTCCCIVQRRRGRRERAIADAQWERDEAQRLEYMRRWQQGDYPKTGTYVNVQEQRHDYY